MKNSTPGTTYSIQFNLAPQLGTAATLTLLSGSLSSSSTVTQVSAGTVGATTGSNADFTVYNDSQYAEGIVTLQYLASDGSTQSAECHVNFLLSSSNPSWAQDTQGSFPSDNTTILLPNSSTYGTAQPIALPPTIPTASGGGGIDSLYQVLNPQVVFLVDKRENGNLLFRGNTPFAAPTVANGPQVVDFAGLDAVMRAQYALQCPDDPSGFPALGSYVLRDICIQSVDSEGGSIQMELNGFSSGGVGTADVPLSEIYQKWYPQPSAPLVPVLRQMSNWPIEPHLHKTNDKIDLATAQQLSTWMARAESLPHVYYIHCASGHDRTGILASTYLIVGRQMSLERALLSGTTISYVPPAQVPQGGQIHTNCVDIDIGSTGNHPVDYSRSRLLLINEIYYHTIRLIYNLVNPDSKVSATPSDWTTSTGPAARVYSKYPWQP